MSKRISKQAKNSEYAESVIQGIPLIKHRAKIRDISDAKNLLSKIISEFMKGNLQNQEAKTLCYLLINYVSICKDSDLEARLHEIESQLEMKR
jgi:hypothetical protein